MFSSSLGRVARSAPHPSISPSITALTSTASIAASSRPFSYRTHQRRYSSSKPSSPPDSSGNTNPQQQAPANASSGTRADGEKRSATRLSRRKAKEAAAEATVKGKDEALMNLPSVPSTPHLHPADVAVSAFFSLHRPISITSSVPSGSTATSFNAIFEPRTRANRQSAEVISTLSSAVETLETASRQHPQYSNEEHDLRLAVTQASISNSEGPRHLDGVPNNSPLQFPSHLLTGKFKPFSPPPAPVPMNSESEAQSTVSGAEDVQAAKQKSYSTVLTILESTHPNGSKTYTARTSPFVANEPEQPPPARFLERMRIRQERWEDYRDGLLEDRGMGRAKDEGGIMQAISVKRQRKLKMKKHKYKKLMKKTRNLRRRLDRN